MHRTISYLSGVATIFAVAAALPAAAQTAIAANAGGTGTGSGTYYGQSFTTIASSTPFNNVTFQWLTTSGVNTGTETGNLYLFSAAYTGSRDGLASSTSSSSYLGTGKGGSSGFVFLPSLTLAGGTQYFAYEDAVNSVFGGNTYAGGMDYVTFNSTSNFSVDGGVSANFRVLASPVAATGAVPEPASWAMMILGMGAVGFALRRRQKVSAQVSFAA